MQVFGDKPLFTDWPSDFDCVVDSVPVGVVVLAVGVEGGAPDSNLTQGAVGAAVEAVEFSNIWLAVILDGLVVPAFTTTITSAIRHRCSPC